jgi:DnaJ-class molecular chaperone
MRSRQWALRLLNLTESEALNAKNLQHSYYNLAKNLHPDTGKGENSEQFQQVTEAYHLLKAELKLNQKDVI